jgi:hypothetical protein
MKPTEGANLESLLEPVIQMNMIIIEEIQEQRKQMHDQQELISAQLSVQSSTTTTTPDALTDIEGDYEIKIRRVLSLTIISRAHKMHTIIIKYMYSQRYVSTKL